MNATEPTRSRGLLVDGDESLRRALASVMRLAGFDAESFASVEALLASGAADQEACLLLDVDMPGVGGFEFKQTLIESGVVRPTVFMTATGREGLDAQLARLDPVAVLHKPFNNEELLEALGRAFE